MEIAKLGSLGVWSWLDHLPPKEVVAFAQRLEAWGYRTLWIPEAVGRDPFALIGFLAANTEKLVFATGIANIYARDPMTMRAVRETLGELSNGRFVLGLGVSHAPMVTGLRKHVYGKPIETMRNYLAAIEAATYVGTAPADPVPTVLAALRPRMLELSRDAARGAHPYFVPPEHTQRARAILGPDAWLCPEQMVLLETDATVARAIARQNIGIYIGLPNYRDNLKWLGFADSDFENGGSDRLVDAIVAWGDEKVIADRIQAHRDAGADHVCIQSFPTDGGRGFDTRVLETFAPARQ
jgi:probable F420-dependent oxidoreductase